MGPHVCVRAHTSQLEPLSAFSTWTEPTDVRGVHEWARKKGAYYAFVVNR
jgi:hypothetical protein